MENKHDELKKLLLILLLGGAVGAGILYYMRSAQNQPVPMIKKIGRTVSEIGEALSSCDLNTPQNVMKSVQDKVPSTLDVISNVTDWVDTGLTLWKKFNKG